MLAVRIDAEGLINAELGCDKRCTQTTPINYTLPLHKFGALVKKNSILYFSGARIYSILANCFVYPKGFQEIL
ncbi:unnamed protein product [Ilex paraguariensis]|uniref:Uncharacterized protein n=1 Tax=Ilex paraguariensis TaxID=185542 RepID=A0ABC8T0W0_9AQUA